MSAGGSVGQKVRPKSVQIFAGLGPNSDFNFLARVRQSPRSVGRTSADCPIVRSLAPIQNSNPFLRVLLCNYRHCTVFKAVYIVQLNWKETEKKGLHIIQVLLCIISWNEIWWSRKRLLLSVVVSPALWVGIYAPRAAKLRFPESSPHFTGDKKRQRAASAALAEEATSLLPPPPLPVFMTNIKMTPTSAVEAPLWLYQVLVLV